VRRYVDLIRAQYAHFASGDSMRFAVYEDSIHCETTRLIRLYPKEVGARWGDLAELLYPATAAEYAATRAVEAWAAGRSFQISMLRDSACNVMLARASGTSLPRQPDPRLGLAVWMRQRRAPPAPPPASSATPP
jgi:hypothetical protein